MTIWELIKHVNSDAVKIVVYEHYSKIYGFASFKSNTKILK